MTSTILTRTASLPVVAISALTLVVAACGGGSDSATAPQDLQEETGGTGGSGGIEGATGGTGGVAEAGSGGAAEGGTGGQAEGGTGGQAEAGAGGTGGQAAGGTGGEGEPEPEPCPDGFAGPDCSDCAPGLVPDGDSCVDPCDGFDCGSGQCVTDQDLEPSCECPKGFIGDGCTECAPGYKAKPVVIGQAPVCELDVPDTNNMVVWLDAADDDAFILDQDGMVSTWKNAVGADFKDGLNVSARPSREVSPGETLPWVHFDGENDRLRQKVDLTGDSYSIFMVAQAGGGSSETLLMGQNYPGKDALHLNLLANEDGDGIYGAHYDKSILKVDAVQLNNFDTTVPFLAEMNHTGNHLRMWMGTAYWSEAAEQAMFQEETLIQLGSNIFNGGQALDGRIAEVIIFSGSTNPKQVRDYLKAKWEL